MNSLLEQLIALTGRLALAAGVSAQTLAELRRFLAAVLVQQNPGFAPVVVDPAGDPAINDAAVAGAELAARFNAAGVRLRYELQPYLAVEAAAERASQVFGPFIDADLALVQFSVFETARFRPLIVRAALFVVDVRQAALLLPAGTLADANDPRRFDIPAGTVWIQARRLVAEAPGHVALRVAGGSLSFAELPQVVAPGGRLEVDFGALWTLDVAPEPAPPAEADGSDGAALGIVLPTRLVMHSAAPPRLEGPLALTGFGTRLRFDTQAGAPVAGGDAIGFPFDVVDPAWSIVAHRSPVFQCAGQAQVVGAVWSLPLTRTDPSQAGEAAHGGAVSVLLRGGPTSRIAGASGACEWRDTLLTASARGLELKGRRASASIAADVVLWGPARSELRFGGQLGGLRHASRRGGADIATLQGGAATNRWDLPRMASGAPFPFDGRADALGLIAEADGLRRIACAASRAEPERAAVQGFVLENLYLHVHPARHMAFVGSGASAVHAKEGAAHLRYDVRLAQPMLPDPYGATWSVRHLDVRLAESAFAARLRWTPDTPPELLAQLDARARLAFPDEGPVEAVERLRESFDGHLGAHAATLALLDLSGHDDLFGVALEPMADPPPQIDADNRLAVRLRNVRLLMQPQVHWEPVEVLRNPAANTNHAEQVLSRSHGGTSLVGAQADTLVPVLPGRVGAQVIRAAQGTRPAAALFSLPFGLRAFVQLERLRLRNRPTGIETLLHRPSFGDPDAGGLVAATQLRLIATGTLAAVPPRPGAALPDPKRGMPGRMLQTDNLVLRNPGPGEPPTNHLTNVLGADIGPMVNLSFSSKVPLHQADLSGHGLSTFSRWRLDPTGNVDVAGVTQVRFDVSLGRTAYEVIEVRSRMLFAQCRVVRTIVMERRNSGRVQRFDSGWNAIDDGTFDRYVGFDTGVVSALRNIRRIRILDRPELVVTTGPRTFVWQPVLFDADAQVEGLSAGGANGRVPVHDHPGYIQLQPVQRDDAPPTDVPGLPEFEGLLAALGGPVGGPIDCAVRLGGVLAMQLARLQVDRAVPDPGSVARFFVTVYGSPSLPRAAPWSAVRIDGATQDVSPVDARRGVPVLRRKSESHYSIIEPADALAKKPKALYGLLMTTPASRVLYPQPSVHPPAGAVPGQLKTAPPRVADPYALAQASGAFPRPAFALQCKEAGAFVIDAADHWKQQVPEFSFAPPLPGVAQGAEWGLARSIPGVDGRIRLALDTALPDVPWDVVAQQPDTLALRLAAIGNDPLFFLESTFADASQALPGMNLPTLRFGEPLNDLKEIINALNQFISLPFDVDVDVAAGNGPSPSFIVRLRLRLRIPSTLNERIDIGVGKFHGLFEMLGELEAALNGATHGSLAIELTGDVQQGILPPLLYAGGAFRFVLRVSDSGPPLIELGLATTTSIGGDLIKNLVELEVTVRYGYTLIPQTLQPGVMLGLEARAKLLGGLLGLSFSADAMARIQRLNRDGDGNTITLWCELRVAATVQVAWFLKEERELRTQFEQELPLGLFALAAGANPWIALATEVL